MAPSTVSPEPLAAAALTAPLARVMFKSSMSRVAVFKVVVVPFTVKFPVIVTSCPTFKFSAIPTPPATTNAPELTVVEVVVALTSSVVIDVANSKIDVLSDIRWTLSVTNLNVLSDAFGVSSGLIKVAPSTDRTPPRLDQTVPWYPSN